MTPISSSGNFAYIASSVNSSTQITIQSKTKE